MQQATAVRDGGARAPRGGWSTDVYRRRPAVVREAGADLVSVGGKGGLLELASSGRRRAWQLPGVELGARPNKRGGDDVVRWPFKVTPQLVMLFLGWLLEGSCAPTKRGGLVSFARVRWVMGARVSWAQLLGCSCKTVTRMVAELAELHLVEQQRLVVDKSRRVCREVPAAYRPGPALLAWLHGAVPPSLDRGTRFPSSGASPRFAGVKTYVDPPEGGHGFAPAEPEAEGLVPESERPAQREPELVGTVAAASAAAPVGDGRPAEGPQLLVAGVSARPAAPPAGKPPGEFVPMSEVTALVRTLTGQLELLPADPPVSELEARRALIAAQLARMKLRRGDDPSGGGAA